jgi:hypothetical protein
MNAILTISIQNTIIEIGKSELLTIAVLAFLGHFLTIGLQHWIEGRGQLRKLSVFDFLKVDLSAIYIICFAIYLYSYL